MFLFQYPVQLLAEPDGLRPICAMSVPSGVTLPVRGAFG